MMASNAAWSPPATYLARSASGAFRYPTRCSGLVISRHSMTRAAPAFPDCGGSSARCLRVGPAAQHEVQLGQGLERGRDVRMGRAKCALQDGEGAPVQGLGLLVLALLPMELREVVERDRHRRMALAHPPHRDRQGPLI